MITKMTKLKTIGLLLILLFPVISFSQNIGIVQGSVINLNTEEPLAFTTIYVKETKSGTTTDISGNFRLELPVGTYTISASYIGYNVSKKFNIPVTSGNIAVINFQLSTALLQLEAVEVNFNSNKVAITTDMITPLSVQKLTAIEIKSNPGGNFDVSKVVQILPGVGGSSGGAKRNDIIIRGGAPNENVYYLDGIEIPVLNHFQTQGSSGGAQGILNVAFIDDVKLTSSAFDAKYDNVLAATFVIKQRQGNREKLSGNIRASLTESMLTLEGPIGKKNDFLASSRISYLDFLFKVIDLPIRPNFSDFQFKSTLRPNNKTTITFLGLGAYDRFSFASTKKDSPENEFLRRSLPYITQWNYTVGTAFKKRIKNGVLNISISRNMFENQIDQFEDAQNQNEDFRIFGLTSQEEENKLRFDFNKYEKGWKYSFGGVLQFVNYNASLVNLIPAQYDTLGIIIIPEITAQSFSQINFVKYGFFTQLSKRVFSNKLLISTGVRTDMNSFTNNGNKPLKTISPRLSLAYHLSNRIDLTGSIGSYYKIPTYTTLGYRDMTGNLVNKPLDYIQSNHYVLGMQFLPNEGKRITLEAFYKDYNNYLVSINNGISLANQGQEFGVVGNEAVISNGDGETYGFEIFLQQKLIKYFYYTMSYTYIRSLFSGENGKLISSAWDNKHLLSSSFGCNLGSGWKLGLKYRFSGGVPYTPYDMEASRQTYATTGNGVIDYVNINSKRLNAFNQLDLRVDRRVNLKKVSFDFFLDIQNLFGFKQEATPYYTFKRNEDNSGFATTDGQALKADGSNAIPLILQNNSTLITPTIGFIFEF